LPDHFFAQVIDPIPATLSLKMVLTQTDVHNKPCGRLTLLSGAKKSNWPKLLVTALVAALLLLAAIVFFLPPPEDDLYTDQTYLRAAEEALASNRLDEAVKFTSLIEKQSDLYTKGCLIAGEAATKLGQLDKALEYYQKIRPTDTDNYPIAQYA
jgi:tetratricopeptide (TPR) repeat protein